MKLKAIKPFSLNGVVIGEGEEFITLEQHGRELIRKGIASDSDECQINDKEPSPTKKKATGRVKRSG